MHTDVKLTAYTSCPSRLPPLPRIPQNKSRTLDRWCIVSANPGKLHGKLPTNFASFLSSPPFIRMSGDKMRSHKPPMEITELPKSQVITQDWYKYVSVLRTFRPSPFFFDFNIWFVYLIHFWTNMKEIPWYRLRKSPTDAHTCTPLQPNLFTPSVSRTWRFQN